MNPDALLSLVIALLAGVLIGLERQIALAKSPASSVDIGGVRTFPLVALSGALAGLLVVPVGGVVVAVALAALVVVVAAHHLGKPLSERDPGITTETAAVVTFLLGVLASTTTVFPTLSAKATGVVGIAIVVALLLSIKEQLHALSARISAVELLGALQLLVVAVVFLPLIPDAGFGPYGAFNPQKMGKMVVLIGVIGFVGFVAARVWGAGRGLLVGGFIGGLVSSTAVAFAMARRAKENPQLVCSCALSIVAANSVMLVRVVVAAALVAPALLPRLAGVLLAMFATSLLMAWPLLRRARGEEHPVADVEVKNPFELKSALLFGVAFSVVGLVSRFAKDTFGAGGLIVAAALAGLTDVDAITLSTAQLANEQNGLTAAWAAAVILTACFTNTVVKFGIATVTGGKALGVVVARVFVPGVVVGGAVAAAQALLT